MLRFFKKDEETIAFNISNGTGVEESFVTFIDNATTSINIGTPIISLGKLYKLVCYALSSVTFLSKSFCQCEPIIRLSKKLLIIILWN